MNQKVGKILQILRSLNFTPKEALEYAIAKIQTKERFLEHRLYRQIEERNASGFEDFIRIYKDHLKSKLPFKSFFYSKALASWCASEDIFFNSEENCRVNKDLMVKAWNKKYPEDKIIDKKEKNNHHHEAGKTHHHHSVVEVVPFNYFIKMLSQTCWLLMGF